MRASRWWQIVRVVALHRDYLTKGVVTQPLPLPLLPRPTSLSPGLRTPMIFVPRLPAVPGSIIMQPSVLEASDRGVYDQRIPAFTRFTPTGVAWDAEVDPTNGGESFPAGEAEVDAVIWCTGYNVRVLSSHTFCMPRILCLVLRCM